MTDEGWRSALAPSGLRSFLEAAAAGLNKLQRGWPKGPTPSHPLCPSRSPAWTVSQSSPAFRRRPELCLAQGRRGRPRQP